MKLSWRLCINLILILTPLFTATFAGADSGQESTATTATFGRKIIFFMGDGMGYEHIRAAGMYLNGQAGTLSFESFPYRSEITTLTASQQVTDSAASATAMATGQKVFEGVISRALPGSSDPLPTVLERHQSYGRSTGLVTTSFVTDASPAAFAAHVFQRIQTDEIAEYYLVTTRPNLLFGGSAHGIDANAALSNGYLLVETATALDALQAGPHEHVSGQFGRNALPPLVDRTGANDLPTLAEMTAAALRIVEQNPQGFFLFVEHEGIDTYSHEFDILRTLDGMQEFEEAVDYALAWAADKPNTLIVVGSDHETGGLIVQQNNGQGNLPTVAWTDPYHTDQPVPVFAWGEGAERVEQVTDNTHVADLLFDYPKVGDLFLPVITYVEN